MSNNRTMRIRRRQLQHAYKHAHYFGIAGPANKTTLETFRLALMRHVQSPDTHILQGSFRGVPVTHFVNVDTRLWVMRDAGGDFLSAWKLNLVQLSHLMKTGRLGGGV